jgi:hypothetical protein
MTAAGHQPPLAAVSAGEDIVQTSNAFYELVDYDGAPDILADANDAHAGLVATGSTGAMILTGTESGPIRVRVEIFNAAPISQDGWDEVADVTQHTPTGTVSVNSPFIGPPAHLPALHIPADSWYHIRVHARGRTAARQFVVGPDEPIEEHLIQLWPESTQTEQLGS